MFILREIKYTFDTEFGVPHIPLLISDRSHNPTLRQGHLPLRER